MEATKSTRKPGKRKPLTDLTNTNQSSHSSSSSLIKPQTKSSLDLPIKSLLNKNPNSDLNYKTTSAATQSDDNVNIVNEKDKEKLKGSSDKENPSSIPSPPPKTPSVSVFEPSTVYKRRSTADKLKGKQKIVMEPLSCPLETRMPDLRKSSKRKALTDLTNTNQSSHSSSSSLIKPQTKSSLDLPIKSLLNKNPNSDLNYKTTSTATQFDDNVNIVNEKDKEKLKGSSDRENSSSIPSPPPKTPSVSVFEPSTVYKRRSTADKLKGKQKIVVEPLSCPLETRMPDLRKKRYGDADINLSKSCPMPCKKKQRREKAEVNDSKHVLPQDFIDKQRAYFAEIDAFELEEEVGSDDELEEMKKKGKSVTE